MATGQNTSQRPSARPGDDMDIQIANAKWGVDGYSRYKTFVPLRVTIRNKSKSNRTLLLRLSRDQVLMEEADVLEQEVLLAAETTKVVHFVPFISDPGQVWMLRWGTTESESHVVQNQSADDGVVLIIPSESLNPRTGMIPTMKEDEFPTSITALDTLRILVLDQEPRWTGARRKSFEEWLIRGGKVVILNTPLGVPPVFSSDFSYLEAPHPTSRHGRGTIQRMNLRAQDITRAVIERDFLHRKLTGGNLNQKFAMYSDQLNGRSIDPRYSNVPHMTSFSRDLVLSSIKDVVASRKYWGLYYACVLVYIVWQWRVGWRWGLVERQPAKFYLWVGGLSLGFAAGFLLIGQMGSSREPRACSVVIARQIHPGLFDVEGWSVLATGMTAGDLKLSAPGSGQLYGASESFGQCPILTRDGRMQIDLPMNSTFKLAFRTRLEMPDLPVSLRSASEELLKSDRDPFAFTTQEHPRIYAAAVAIGDRLYVLSEKSGQLKPTQQWGITMADWMFPYSEHQLKRNRNASFSLLTWLFGHADREEMLNTAFGDVLGNGFSVGQTVFADSFTAPSGFARVMLYVDLPPELRLEGDFTAQSGRMLYVVDQPIQGGGL